jgi:hypothetical protein
LLVALAGLQPFCTLSLVWLLPLPLAACLCLFYLAASRLFPSLLSHSCVVCLLDDCHLLLLGDLLVAFRVVGFR